MLAVSIYNGRKEVISGESKTSWVGWKVVEGNG